MLRVDVRPELLRWARERADQTIGDLSKRFPKIEDWERGKTKPTLKQLERYARATYTPAGLFFLAEPESARHGEHLLLTATEKHGPRFFLALDPSALSALPSASSWASNRTPDRSAVDAFLRVEFLTEGTDDK